MTSAVEIKWFLTGREYKYMYLQPQGIWPDM